MSISRLVHRLPCGWPTGPQSAEARSQGEVWTTIEMRWAGEDGEDRGRRESDRARVEGPQKGDAQGGRVQGDEAAGLFFEARGEAATHASGDPVDAPEERLH